MQTSWVRVVKVRQVLAQKGQEFLKRTLERGTEVTATGEDSKSIQRAVRGLDGRMTLCFYYYVFNQDFSECFMESRWKGRRCGNIGLRVRDEWREGMGMRNHVVWNWW